MRKCRLCKGMGLEKILSLGDQPLVNKYPQQNEQTELYPLELFRCTQCELIQLGYVVPKDLLYPDDYPYIPSVSKTNLEHFDKVAESLVDELELSKDSLVVDIGSNDGSLLKAFDRRGVKVAGIEPAKTLVDVANKVNIPTLHGFISSDIARQVVEKFGKAKLVTMTNVLAHIDNLQPVLKALDILLDDDGVFFAQFPDVRNLLKQNQFDTIYHEHHSYFSYESIYYLFKNSPFELYKIDSTTLHGGSMKIQVRRRSNPFGEFILGTERIKKELYDYLSDKKSQGAVIAGFGAAAKGVIMLKYCGLDNKIVDYVVDGTPYKQGKYMPATYIPIYPEEHLLENPPDVVVILAWNFQDEIMEKLKGRGYTFVIPIPKVHIYEDRNRR